MADSDKAGAAATATILLLFASIFANNAAPPLLPTNSTIWDSNDANPNSENNTWSNDAMRTLPLDINWILWCTVKDWTDDPAGFLANVAAAKFDILYLYSLNVDNNAVPTWKWSTHGGFDTRVELEAFKTAVRAVLPNVKFYCAIGDSELSPLIVKTEADRIAAADSLLAIFNSAEWSGAFDGVLDDCENTRYGYTPAELAPPNEYIYSRHRYTWGSYAYTRLNTQASPYWFYGTKAPMIDGSYFTAPKGEVSTRAIDPDEIPKIELWTAIDANGMKWRSPNLFGYGWTASDVVPKLREGLETYGGLLENLDGFTFWWYENATAADWTALTDLTNDYDVVPPILSASTELIDYSSMTTAGIASFIDTIRNQGISELTLRLNAMTDWSTGAPNAATVTKAKAIITAADAVGIAVNLDLHTWYTTWENSFDDTAAGHAANRATYLTYVAAAVNAFAGYSVKAWMVLNEPQAQTASVDENTFILDCIATAQALTDSPVSVRFMCGYSPSTGHYNNAIDTASDFLCRNTYWDPRRPTVEVYGTTEAKLLAALSVAHSQLKELWITEFGKSKSNTEEQRSYVEHFVTYALQKGIDRIFCWVSQPVGGSAESYNIFNGYTPLPAFYELTISESTPPPVEPPIEPPPATYYYVSTYAMSGGNVSPAVTNQPTLVGQSFTCHASASIDYIFDRWYLNGDDTGSTNVNYTISDAVSNNTYALVAAFTANPPTPPTPPTPPAAEYYSVVVESQVGGFITNSGTTTLLVGEVFTSEATPDTQHRFTYWLKDGTTSYTVNHTLTFTGTAAGTYTFLACFQILEELPPSQNPEGGSASVGLIMSNKWLENMMVRSVSQTPIDFNNILEQLKKVSFA